MVLRVLLVDDEETLTEIAKVFLERDEDLKVDTSPSAKNALEKLKSDNYDVIVSDYMMPEMNGIELLKMLKSEDNTTPFILFTGRGREDVAIDALNSGASFYLQKGGDPKSEFAELTNMIKRSARHARVEKAHAELMVDIQRSHRLLSATLESTVDGILGVDRDGNVLVYNNRFVEIWGIPEQVIKSRHWDQMMPCILDQLKDPDEFKNTIYNGYRELNLQDRSIVELKDGRVLDYVSNPMHVDDEAVGRIATFRDITNEARAEGTLRREKEKAQQYLSLAGVMLLALDEHGKVTLVNKRGCEILGYEEGQILGKSWFENFLPESIRGQFRAVFKGLMDGNLGPLDHQLPHPVLCRGGVEKYIAFTNALLKNEKGDITGTLSSGEDVTERKQAEEALKVSLAKYTTLFESMPLGITIADKDGNITESNKEAERLLGLSREDQIKRQIDGQEWRIVRPDGSLMPASEYASVRAMKENHRCSDVEMGVVKGDGSTSWINVTAAPIPLDGSGVAITYTDITDRKQTEDALRKSESSYRQLADGITDMFLALDKDLRCTYWNKACEERTGISARDAIGRSLTELSPGPQGERAKEEYLDVLRTGKARTYCIEVSIGGKNHVAESTAYPLEDGLSIITKDITERKRAEEALQKSEAKFAVAFNSSPQMMAINSLRDGRMIEVNDSFLRGLGQSREAVLGRTITEIGVIDVAQRDRIRSVMEEKGIVEGLEIHARTKGEDRIALLSAAVVSIEGEPCMLSIISDITDSKQAAIALRELEGRYHNLVEGMLEGVAYCRMLYDERGHPVDWIYLTVNGNFEKLTGLHNITGKRVTEAIPGIEKADPTLFEIYGRVASNGKPETFEMDVKSLGQWLRVSVFCPEKDHFVAAFEDITKRKQAENALKESEKKYRQLVEIAQEGIWTIDVDANTTYTNPRMAEMLGYTPEEMMGRHLFSFMDEHGKEIAQIGLDRREKGIKEQHDFEFLRKDGQRIYASLETSPIMDEAGNYTGALAVVADITERKKSEVAIAESLEKRRELESIIDKSPAIAFTWKPGPQWSVAYVSGNIRQFGYVPEDFTSRRMTYADLVHPADLKRVFGESEAYAKEGVSEFTQEYRILTKSGDVRWVDGRTVILRNSAGESIFHQGIIFDITEQRRVEKALKLANKKLALLGSVTRHDAINQLTVLMSWLDIAMEVGKDLPTMEQLIRVQESARMLQGQLEFTAGYQELGIKQPQWTDLKVAACAGVEGIELGAVSLKLDLKGAEIFADPMLEKVFHNLVGNSLRHGEKVTQIRLYLEESDGKLIIVCEDDGVGITVDEKEKIFVRGYGKHTGLGLYLAREILELTGIAIKETGVPGKDARFELLVPAGNYKIGRGG